MQAYNHPIIIIPEPCNESWDKMTPVNNGPTGQGRHCSSCEKTVVDFTTMSNDEILGYLSRRNNERVCGRFKTEQVRQPVIISAQYLVSARWSVTQAIRLAIFIVFSSSLFSCTNAQTGKKEKAQIVIEDHTSSGFYEGILLGAPEMPASPPVTTVKGEVMVMGEFVESPTVDCLTPEVSPPDSTESRIIEGKVRKPDPLVDDSVLTFTMGKVRAPIIDKITAPVYPGGESELNYFMRMNLRYPEMEHQKMIQGTMNVRLTISEKGAINKCEILNTIPGSKNFEAEIKRVCNKMPAWKPAINNGTPVEGVYVLPVRFRLGD